MQRRQESKLTLFDARSGEIIGEFVTPLHRTITIGRDESNNIQLSDRGVSKLHCRVLWDQEKYFIEDMGSTNGVAVVRAKDKSSILVRSRTADIQSGDSIHLGEASLRFEIQSSNNDQTEIVRAPISQATEVFQFSADKSKGAVATENPMRAIQTYQPKTFPIAAPSSPLPSSRSQQTLLKKLLSDESFTFGRYKVIRKIGEGGMGAVYSAVAEDKSELAIKFLKSQQQSPQDFARFAREIEIAKQLKHTAIVDCLDCGQEEGIPYIVMPYCSGGNLSELLSRTGTIQLRRAFRLIDRLVGGLEYAHKLGIVHRDIKPCNILLGKDTNGKYRPMISDFGLAKFYQLAGDSGMTTNGTVGGSWPYMPPEQLTNFRFVTPQSDVWSIGAVLYECLTGQLPRGPSPKKDPYLAVLNAKVIPIASVVGQSISPRVSRFVMKSLATDVEERFSDAGEMRNALHTVARAEGIEL